MTLKWECHSWYLGPCYDVIHTSKFIPNNNEVEIARTLNYPIFNVDHQNKFHELESKIFDLKKLEGPVYSIERKHHFQEIEKKMDQLKEMSYPIREGVNPHHLYGELEQNIQEIKTLGTVSFEFSKKGNNLLKMKLDFRIEIKRKFFSWSCL